MPKRIHLDLQDFAYLNEGGSICRDRIIDRLDLIEFPMRYAFHDAMVRQDLEDILEEDVFQEILGKAKDRKWLRRKRRSRAEIWKKYKYLSYVPYSIVRLVASANYIVKRIKNPKFKNMAPNQRRSEASELVMFAAHAGLDSSVLEELITVHKAEADGFRSTYGRFTPLMVAVNHGHTQTAKTLIRLGAEPRSVAHGKSLVDIAAMSGSLETLKYACSLLPDDNLEHALHLAASAGSEDCIRFLIHEKGMERQLGDATVLTFAVQGGSTKIVSMLINEYGFDINATPPFSRSNLTFAFEDRQLEMVKHLVERHNANLKSTVDHRSPLIFASYSKKLTDYLEAHGASIDEDDEEFLDEEFQRGMEMALNNLQEYLGYYDEDWIEDSDEDWDEDSDEDWDDDYFEYFVGWPPPSGAA
jgi:ankyrin repeat protein